MTESHRLTDAERLRLADDGFVLRENVFSGEECQAMAAAVEQLETDLLAAKRNNKVTLGSYMFELQREIGSVVKWEPHFPDVVQGVEPFAHISKPLKEWAHDPRLWNPCKDVVGQDDISLFTEKITMKRAHKGGTIILHQDFPYWKPVTKVADRVMTAMIYLDDATRINGCLEVSPGSHKDGMRACKTADGFGANEMDESKFDMASLVAVEAKAGSVIFFGSMLVHRSLPNRSDKQRRALLYSYQPAGNPTMIELSRWAKPHTAAAQ